MLRIACGAALALPLLIAAPVAAGAQEGSSGDWYDTKILRKVLETIGVRQSEENIEYRERSPLVIPPSAALPPPEKGSRLTNNPAWPKDPDVLRARGLNKPGPAISYEEDSRALRPSELNRGSVRGRRQRTASSGKPDAVDDGQALLPSELGSKGLFNGGKLFGYKDEVVKFTGEPTRNTLTDPPVGYRTPSAAQPYGIVTSKNKSAKPTNDYVTRGEVKQ